MPKGVSNYNVSSLNSFSPKLRGWIRAIANVINADRVRLLPTLNNAQIEHCMQLAAWACWVWSLASRTWTDKEKDEGSLKEFSPSSLSFSVVIYYERKSFSLLVNFFSGICWFAVNPERSSGHVQCIFDYPAENFPLKVWRFFAPSPKISITS